MSASRSDPQAEPEQLEPAAAEASAPAGTPIVVRVLYVLGILAAIVFVASTVILVTAYFVRSDDEALGFEVSIPAILIWGGVVVAAAVTWLWRRGAPG